MTRRLCVVTVTLSLLFALPGCSAKRTSEDSKQGRQQDLQAIAQAASDGVAVVGKVSQGKRGAPTLILQEDHTSRVGQIQLAITLARLYNRYALRNIALEGYLKEDPEINTDWFVNQTRALNSKGKLDVAVRLLKEGEINSVEFLKLIYPDVQLHPVETTGEYSAELDQFASQIPKFYLVQIAQESLSREQADLAARLQKESEKLQGEQKQKKINQMLDYILSADPWAKTKARVFDDPNASKGMSAEDLLSLMEEINSRAKHLSAQFPEEDRRAMERNINFWRLRSRASKTMASSTEEIADRQAVPLVVLKVGEFHTEAISNHLSEGGRAFVVITPLAVKNGERRGDITEEMLNRKYEKLSIYSDGLTGLILKASSASSSKNPPMTLDQEWLKRKAELYGVIKEVAHLVFGPPPPHNLDPINRLHDDYFKRLWVYIDKKKIELIRNPEDGSQSVRFPITLNYDDDDNRRDMWFEVTQNLEPGQVNEVTEAALETVEKMLMSAMSEVRSEGEPGKDEISKAAEGRTGRLKLGSHVVRVADSKAGLSRKA